MSDENFDAELNSEVTRRLSMMEEPDYEFPERMSKLDFAIAGVLMMICLVFLACTFFEMGTM